jgi:hypothetical protein
MDVTAKLQIKPGQSAGKLGTGLNRDILAALPIERDDGMSA